MGSLFYGVENLRSNTLTSGVDAFPPVAINPNWHTQITTREIVTMFNDTISIDYLVAGLDEIRRHIPLTLVGGDAWYTRGHGVAVLNNQTGGGATLGGATLGGGSVSNAIVKVHVNFTPLAQNTQYTQSNNGDFAPNQESQQIINDFAKFSDSAWAMQYKAYERVKHLNGRIFGVTSNVPALWNFFGLGSRQSI